MIEPNSSNGQHPRGKQTPESDWLSLRDARNLLEVSDTTLRQWADAGHLRVYRTPGGHRRFLREDVEALTQGPPPSPEPVRADSREAPALRRIRRRLGQDSVTQQPWFQAVEPEGHDRMRLFGRRLLSLLMQEPGRAAAGRNCWPKRGCWAMNMVRRCWKETWPSPIPSRHSFSSVPWFWTARIPHPGQASSRSQTRCLPESARHTSAPPRQAWPTDHFARPSQFRE